MPPSIGLLASLLRRLADIIDTCIHVVKFYASGMSDGEKSSAAL
jgi:hypothetical protein